MILSELALIKGVYVDEDTLEKYGHFNAYISEASYIMLCLGSREAGHVYLHRYLFSNWKYVDHINGNPTDCRKVNLREANQSLNNANQRIRKDNTSGYKGVSFRADRNKFRAYVVKDSQQINLGYFDNAKDAALAYNKKAAELYGEFAKLNEVKEYET